MITIDDCQAFCDAPPRLVDELAGREHLPLVQAFALAHIRARQISSHPQPEVSTMMTMQARQSFPPHTGKAHPLRSYPANSPRAMARLVVLALLADGELDERELAVLDRRGAFAAIGISREDFVQVLHEFCADLARLSERTGVYRLPPALLAALFAEVSAPQARERLLNLIVAVVGSDGRFSEGERTLFLNALEAWEIPSPDGQSWLPGSRRVAGTPLQR